MPNRRHRSIGCSIRQVCLKEEIRNDILKLTRNNGHKAWRPKEMARQLGYRDRGHYEAFRNMLGTLEREGLLAKVKGGKYQYRSPKRKSEGVLSVTPQGFGFIKVDGRKEDLYVRRARMKNALDGDTVAFAIRPDTKGKRNAEADVLKVLKRKRTDAVGTFRDEGYAMYVEPDDPRLIYSIYLINPHPAVEDGDKVVVTIERFDDPRSAPMGHIREVLGSSEDPRTQVLALARSFDIEAGFAAGVRAEAEAIPTRIPEEALVGRRDFRATQTFTIDPIDAKDFDDAIHLTPLPDGDVQLGVHIADVSHYVAPGSQLDDAAFVRSTSVYLVDRVIPMLPEKLSNEVCSLRPHEDKLTMTCLMDIDASGAVTRYEIMPSIIRSQHRMTYEEAQELIDYPEPSHPLHDALQNAAKLAARLTAQRFEEGSIDFDLPEVKVVLDAEGIVKTILKKERKAANRLIEEFMLLANQTVARHLANLSPKRPSVYRVHEYPDAPRIQNLAKYVRAFGYRLNHNEGRVEARDLNALLREVHGLHESVVIETAALRAMAKAKYSTNNVGHYGLGFQHYTHFTSPIRRYPDLIIHRLLKHYAAGGSPVDRSELERQCDHCSEREKAAVEAERASVKLKQVAYIQQHLGETFDGVINGVARHGVYVELTDILIEGLVHVRDLDDDYYDYDEQRYAVIGRRRGRMFRLGDPVRVVVAAANIETREIDFVFADA